MGTYSKLTPKGTRDILFEECAAQREARRRLSQVFSLRGYHEVLTPGLEFFDVFNLPGGGHPPAGDVQVHRQPGQAPGAAAGLHPAHRPDGGLPAAAAAEAPALLLRPDSVPQQPGPFWEKRRVRPDGHRAHGGTGPAGGPGGHRRGGGGTVHLRGEFPGGDRPRPGSSGPWPTSCPCLRGSGSSCGPPSSRKNYAAPLRTAGPPGAHPGGGGHAPAAPAFWRAGGAGPGGALVRRGTPPRCWSI